MALQSLACSRLRLLAPSLRSVRLATPCFNRQPFRAARPFSVTAQMLEKKYMEEHDWIELHSDGKTGALSA